MNDFQKFITNKYLYVPLLLWFCIQTFKVIYELIKYKKFTFNKLFSLKKHSKNEVVTAFTGLLEMSRRNKVITEQSELFGDIDVEKTHKIV